MSSFERFILNLQFIFMPSYWFMNESYSPSWDKELNELLDKYEFTNFDFCTACLGETVIWTSSYPFAAFTNYTNKQSPTKYRASRLTILRAYNKIKDCPEFNDKYLTR
jgi:hypothetical protein